MVIGERAVRFEREEIECISMSNFGARRIREMRESVRGAILQAVSTKLADAVK
jgi:hypothetical protein